MKQISFLTVLLLCSVSVLSSGKALAEELQITDYFGLIRAQRDVDKKVDVKISVLRSQKMKSRELVDKPVLTQRTGFAGDIEAVEEAPDTFIFKSVSAGSWRIRLRNSGLLLDRVEILGSPDQDKTKDLN